MVKSARFDKYLSTCFAGPRDLKAWFKAYENDYASLLPANKQSVILDIGCGTGEFMIYLRSNGDG